MRKVLYILGCLTDRDVDWLTEAGKIQRLEPGSVLIRQGEPVDAVYIVLSGKVTVSQGDVPHEVRRLGAGEIVGEMSFVDASPPSATVRSVGACVVLRVAKATLMEHLRQDEGFAARFYRAIAMFLSDRLRSAMRTAQTGESGALAESELDLNVLDTVTLAGDRFSRMLKKALGA